MSQSQTSSSASSYARHLYRHARKLLLGQRDSLSPSMDKDSARSWVAAYGAAMRDLSVRARAAGVDLAGDLDVDGLLKYAQESILHFATSEWFDLAPAFMDGLQDAMKRLGPEVTLGDAYPEVFSKLPRAPVAAAPSSSVPSSPTIPPPSRLPSSASGVSRPVPPGSPDADRAARPSKPLPRRAHSRAGHSPTAASTRPRTEAAALRPGTRPVGWETCARCRQRKTGCVPPKGAVPLGSSCFRCLLDGMTCVRGPEASSLSHSRRQLSPPPPPPAKPAEPPAPTPAPALSPPPADPPSLFLMSTDDQFSDDPPPPAVPLHGSRLAPLPDLLAWRAEICSSQGDRLSARRRLADADKRHRVAWENYLSLLGNVYVDSLTSGAPGGSLVGKARKENPLR